MYKCMLCNFECNIKSNLIKHNLTSEHERNIMKFHFNELDKNINDNNCDKNYVKLLINKYRDEYCNTSLCRCKCICLNKTYNCNECDKKYVNRQSLYKHKINNHNKKKKSEMIENKDLK